MRNGQSRLMQRIRSHEKVESIEKKGNHFIVRTKCGREFKKSRGFGDHNALNHLHLRLGELQ